MTARPQHLAPYSAGVTLTELLLVLVIVSLLSAMITPTVVRRQRQSRIHVAEADVRELAAAQDAVGLNFGYYVPLQLLDDIPGSFVPSDAIENEDSTILLVDLLESVQTQPQVSLGSAFTNGRVAKLVEGWEGPFIHFQRAFRFDDDPTNPITLALDHPLDPWGNPYILYSPIGVIGSGAGGLALSNTYPEESDYDNSAFSNGFLSSSDDRFDRFAVVSFGPDGVRGSEANPSEFGDDIIYFFGHLEPEVI